MKKVIYLFIVISLSLTPALHTAATEYYREDDQRQRNANRANLTRELQTLKSESSSSTDPEHQRSLKHRIDEKQAQIDFLDSRSARIGSK